MRLPDNLSQNFGKAQSSFGERLVYVFKTNVSSSADAKTIAELLASRCQGADITFDLQDCDKVLRIAQPRVSASEIIHIVSRQGFACEELM